MTPNVSNVSSFVGGAQVQANGIRQHFLRYSPKTEEAPTLVVMPGITSPAVTWGFVAERLGRRYDTYVLDFRGRGLSSSGTGLDYSIDTLADDLNEFLRVRSLQTSILMGHSMGARVIARMLAKGTAMPPGLVLIDPPMSGPGRPKYPYELSSYLEAIAWAQRGCSAEDLRGALPTWSHEHRALRAEWLHTCDPRAVTAAHDAFHAECILQDVPHLRAPTLLMTAEHGGVVSAEDVERIHDSSECVQHVRIPDAGHMIPWDNVSAFHAALDPFLSTHSKGTLWP
ncbi:MULTISPECIES: alpha/beta hydrolase [Comamonadaceae]|uniref:alpha/beta fold hydrolase n=1 Tax=Comamonadaceae TaxID=80864 RepID=UPI000AFDA56A|nr:MULTISPECIES: alpha/beta hydrolase [Comamonadaceae]PNG50601.1 N-formylmaleamate deformylase [Variovorax sp. B2]PNG51470.1 N-formylmaleamate deformylase [Variovorax sp. B4]VTV17782.1 N-formylmaleamate deformylase [Variovorax sp. WDL1]